MFLDCLSFQKKTNRKKVLITGFGPFSEMENNPSWEGVKCLDKGEIEKKYNIFLRRQEIQVRYADVDRIVTKLWDNFEPDLTIHVGVSEACSRFTLETRANKFGYEILDIDDKSPEDHQNPSVGANLLITELDVSALCDEFNSNPPREDLLADVSDDAGLYLCEYIYYTSLCRGPSLFVHVPLNTYTPEQIALGLERILELCLHQLSDEFCYCC